jgi:hypothetical protein
MGLKRKKGMSPWFCGFVAFHYFFSKTCTAPKKIFIVLEIVQTLWEESKNKRNKNKTILAIYPNF